MLVVRTVPIPLFLLQNVLLKALGLVVEAGSVVQTGRVVQACGLAESVAWALGESRFPLANVALEV